MHEDWLSLVSRGRLRRWRVCKGCDQMRPVHQMYQHVRLSHPELFEVLREALQGASPLERRGAHGL